jgi:hypothetical protein
MNRDLAISAAFLAAISAAVSIGGQYANASRSGQAPRLIAGKSAGTPAPHFKSGHGLLDARIALATYSRKKIEQQERSIDDHRNRL